MGEHETAAHARALEREVARAKGGDSHALESVVSSIQKDIYNLAIRFLWHQQDAEDATQEILIRVITGLSGFRAESGFRTWVYRVACNTLLNLRKRRMEQRALSFEEFGEDLARGLSDTPFSIESDVTEALLLEEVKIGCTLAMLQCLDRDHRLAYILGEVMELDHRQAARALDTTPAAYRKRLSRARATIIAFMTAHCGLTNPVNACRCRRRVTTAVALKRVDPSQLVFARSHEQARRFPEVLAEIRRLEESRRAAALYRSHPELSTSDAFVAWLRKLLDDMPDRNVSEGAGGKL